MKKLFLIAAMAVFAVTANAQIVSSSSVHSESNNYWFVRAGLGFNGVTKIDDTKAKIGYEFEVGHAWMLGGQGAHIDAALGIASRGYKVEYNEEGGKYSGKLTAHNLYLAPTFGWKIPVADKISIDPHAGLYFGYDLGGKEKVEEEYEGTKTSGDANLGDIDGYKKFDAGLKLGAGVWIGKFNVDLAYKFGFTKMYDGDDSPKSHSFDISVAYAF